MNAVQNPTTRANRRYTRNFLITMGLYVLTLPFAVGYVNILPEDNALRYLIILIPVLPLLATLVVFLRWLREVDEFQRKVQFEGFGFSMAVTIVVTLTLGFLEQAGFPKLDTMWIPIMMIFLWGLGVAIANGRYK
jgi:hypothetical protein